MTYLFSPTTPTLCQPTFSLEEYLLRESLQNLIYPSDLETHPHWQTPMGQLFLAYKAKVIGQFIRRNLDKNFKGLEMPRQWAKSVKEQINFDAALMSLIWRIVKLLPSPPLPQPIVFHYIISEAQLIFFQFSADETSQESVTNFIKSQQTLDRSLESLEKNPFDPSSAPDTWSFIDNCNRVAARSDDFRRDYMQLVRARMSSVRSLKESLPKRFDQSGQAKEKRGRNR